MIDNFVPDDVVQENLYVFVPSKVTLKFVGILGTGKSNADKVKEGEFIIAKELLSL